MKKVGVVWIFFLTSMFFTQDLFPDVKPKKKHKKMSVQEAVQIAEKFAGKKIPGLKQEDPIWDQKYGMIRLSDDNHDYYISIYANTGLVRAYYSYSHGKKMSNMTVKQIKSLIRFSKAEAEQIAFQFVKTHYNRFPKAQLLLYKTHEQNYYTHHFEWRAYKKIGKYKALYNSVKVEVSLVEGVVGYEANYADDEVYEILDNPANLPKQINVSEDEILGILQQNLQRSGFTVVGIGKPCCGKPELTIAVSEGKVFLRWSGIACGGKEFCYPAVTFTIDAFTGAVVSLYK